MAELRRVCTDDKRLQSTLKRLGVNSIPGIEEVNLFKQDGSIVHFKNPQVQASIGANTYVISGSAENKKLQDLLPGESDTIPPSTPFARIAGRSQQKNAPRLPLSVSCACISSLSEREQGAHIHPSAAIASTSCQTSHSLNQC